VSLDSNVRQANYGYLRRCPLITQILSSVTTYYYASESFFYVHLWHYPISVTWTSTPRRGKRFYLYSKMSRLALGPTQSPTGLYCGIFPWGSSRQDEADHSPPSNAEVHDWSYASTPLTCHHSMYRDNNLLLIAHKTTHKSCLTHHCPKLTLSLQKFHSWMLTYIHTFHTYSLDIEMEVTKLTGHNLQCTSTSCN
jgi:hypothetical protein